MPKINNPQNFNGENLISEAEIPSIGRIRR